VVRVGRTAALFLVVVSGLAGVVANAPAEPDRPNPPADQRIGQLAEEARKEAEARRNERATPAARRRRLESREAFRGLGAEHALELTRGRFEKAVQPRGGPALDVPRGGRVLEYPDDRTAKVQHLDGDRLVQSLVTSVLPMRDGDDAGRIAPVDYSLNERDGGYEAVNPLVDVHLPARLSAGISVGELRVRPMVRGDGGAASRWEDSIFYAGIDADTDVIVKPIPTGLELFHQLRSPDAPEQLRVELDVPDDVRLSKQEDRIMITRGQETLGRIAPVAAVDAAGTTVPATMTLDGARLLLSVPHREQDFEYPILVDPAIENYAHWGNGTGPQDSGGWDQLSSHGSLQRYTWYGLHHTGPAATTWIDANHNSQWRYPARAGSRIYRAIWQFTSAQNPNGNECHFLGFLASTGYWSNNGPWNFCYAHGITAPAEQCASAQSPCTGGGSDGNSARWGSSTLTSAYRNTSSYDSTLTNATIYIQDTKAPGIAPLTPSGQTYAEPAPTVNFAVSDDGVGLKEVKISRSGIDLYKKQWTSCAGTLRTPCGWSWTAPLNVNSLPYGTSTIRVDATDYLDNPATVYWTVTRAQT
jgi:hypothetical protein